MENLVVCVDRDDDVGRKTKASGPVIGFEDNLTIARELALVDPEDTDSNAIFAAVKIAKELGTEVVTLTGDRSVGITSDTKIAKQLDDVIERFKPAGVILVIDGAEDEQIIPIIESRVKINSVKTVIVRQSQELEKAYFKITHFLREVEEDPNLARLVFGIPGVVLMLLAIGGAFGVLVQALNIVLAVIGVYLLIKGFGYEEEFFTKISLFLKSLSVEKISTFTYILSAILVVVAVSNAYEAFLHENPTDLIYTIAALIRATPPGMNAPTTADFVLAAIVVAVIGKIIDDYSTGKYLNVRTDLVFLALAFLVKLTVESWANYIGFTSGITDFLIAVIIGGFIFIAVIKITEYFFIEEITARKNLIAEYANREVCDEKGASMGKVNRVILDGSRLVGIKIKRKIVSKDDIVSKGEKIIVKAL